MSSKRTLLLNASYEVLSLIPFRRAIKLLYKGKVEVLSSWEEIVVWGSEVIRHPAILRLKELVRRNFYHSGFSRQALLKRDQYTCQYCNKRLANAQITIDHVLPRSRGGNTSFTNCVVACRSCNTRKDDQTPEEAKMPLLRKPMHPSVGVHSFVMVSPQEDYHPDWQGLVAT